MSYMVVSRTEPPHTMVAATVTEALELARELGQAEHEKVTILSDSGWILSLDELENLIEG
ncbi:hypothetical protein ACFOWB_22060 [Chenggangzhangella methanolivorans]